MAQFTVNASRFDPYKNFKFRVKWDGRYVAGVSRVSAFRRVTEVIEHREGSEVALASFRKDIVIEFCNEAGQVAIAYKVYRCWVSEYQPLPALDADSAAAAFQSITLQHEGWERDVSVSEPQEPKST